MPYLWNRYSQRLQIECAAWSCGLILHCCLPSNLLCYFFFRQDFVRAISLEPLLAETPNWVCCLVLRSNFALLLTIQFALFVFLCFFSRHDFTTILSGPYLWNCYSQRLQIECAAWSCGLIVHYCLPSNSLRYYFYFVCFFRHDFVRAISLEPLLAETPNWVCCLVLQSNFALLLTIQFASLISSLINIISLLLTTLEFFFFMGSLLGRIQDDREPEKVGEWRGVIVVHYLSNDITVCSGFILANETMICLFFFIIIIIWIVSKFKLFLSMNIYHYINSCDSIMPLSQPPFFFFFTS